MVNKNNDKKVSNINYSSNENNKQINEINSLKRNNGKDLSNKNRIHNILLIIMKIMNMRIMKKNMILIKTSIII